MARKEIFEIKWSRNRYSQQPWIVFQRWISNWNLNLNMTLEFTTTTTTPAFFGLCFDVENQAVEYQIAE
jgi:hypothetical protein